MRLWLDDVRPAPEGWALATTAREAIALLDEHGASIEEVSLDHDLGASPSDGLYARGWAEESGLLVAQHIATSNILPTGTPITIHSWSPSGARNMANALEDAGYRPVVQPYRIG